MTYEVYAGGINAVTAEVDIAYEDRDRYRLSLSAATRGFLKKLAPWQGVFFTEGWRKTDGSDRPELHKSVSFWRDEEEIKEYHYAPDGSFKAYTVVEEGENRTPAAIDEALTKGTTDALTAALELT